MSKLLSLVALASIALTGVSALEITFKRFSQNGCNAATQHIAADTHLRSTNCKSFDTDEPDFYSFMISPEDDMEELDTKYCQAVVFPEENCEGQPFTFGNMANQLDKCTDTPVPGRSVLITCSTSSSTITGVLPTSVTGLTYVVEPTFSKVKPTTTITLVPSWQHDDYLETEDDDFLSGR